MNIDSLRYFQVAARLGKLSRAAQELHVSQPTLTISIQKLEEHLGVMLFERTRHGVTLTSAGSRVLIDAQEILSSWEVLKSQAKEVETEVKGVLRIGCHSIVASYALPQILPKLLSQNPKLSVDLKHDLSRRIVHAVQANEIDIGLVINPSRASDLVLREVLRDEVTCLKHKSVKDNSVIIYDPNLFQSQSILEKLKKKKIEFGQRIESSSLEVIARFLSERVGHAILPSRAVPPHLKEHVVESFSEIAPFEDKLYLAFKPTFRTSHLGKATLDVFKDLKF
jgi:DNA-binding transcriptional LysR family regulator